jgi:hypothetical protein
MKGFASGSASESVSVPWHLPKKKKKATKTSDLQERTRKQVKVLS